LDSLIPADFGDAQQKETGVISIDLIDANPNQPRKSFDETALAELAASIREHGVLQPLLVSKNGDRFELIAGERRFRAAKIAGLTEVPVIERSFDEQQKLEVSIIENLQRENLNPIELALSYKRLMDEFGLTQEQVAEKVKRGRSTVTNTMRLLTLPFEIKQALAEGKISEGHGRTLLNLPTEKQMDMFYRMLNEGMNVREAEKSKAPRIGSPKVKDPNILAAEKKMGEVFGTKVEIVNKASGGKVVIEYYSPEDLERIFRKIVQG
jgi:ParB family chromosome partitioning protein